MSENEKRAEAAEDLEENREVIDEALLDLVEDYITDEELDEDYVEPDDDEIETYDEEKLDELAALAGLKEENYITLDGAIEDEH